MPVHGRYLDIRTKDDKPDGIPRADITVLQASDRKLQLQWTPPARNGRAIERYYIKFWCGSSNCAAARPAKPAASTTLFRRPAPGVEIKPHPQAQIMLRSIALVVGWTLTISVFPCVNPACLDLDSNPYALTIWDHLGLGCQPRVS